MFFALGDLEIMLLYFNSTADTSPDGTPTLLFFKRAAAADFELLISRLRNRGILRGPCSTRPFCTVFLLSTWLAEAQVPRNFNPVLSFNSDPPTSMAPSYALRLKIRLKPCSEDEPMLRDWDLQSCSTSTPKSDTSSLSGTPNFRPSWRLTRTFSKWTPPASFCSSSLTFMVRHNNLHSRCANSPASPHQQPSAGSRTQFSTIIASTPQILKYFDVQVHSASSGKSQHDPSSLIQPTFDFASTHSASSGRSSVANSNHPRRNFDQFRRKPSSSASNEEIPEIHAIPPNFTYFDVQLTRPQIDSTQLLNHRQSAILNASSFFNHASSTAPFFNQIRTCAPRIFDGIRLTFLH
ncbi:hypothetical protein C8R46DRAFT_1184273 [Mycena filopes]|nr:hypothetical protein C8R46DRAFT_1184273 [Mycena filopes]